jgi:hypothetical protein
VCKRFFVKKRRLVRKKIGLMCAQLDASFHCARRDRLFSAPPRRRFRTQCHISTTCLFSLIFFSGAMRWGGRKFSQRKIEQCPSTSAVWTFSLLLWCENHLATFYTLALSFARIYILVKRDMLRENAILHVLADTRTKSYDVLLPTFTSTLERDCNPIDSLNSL